MIDILRIEGFIIRYANNTFGLSAGSGMLQGIFQNAAAGYLQLVYYCEADDVF